MCESGGGDDGYWSLLSAYWSLSVRAYAFDRAIMPGEAWREPATVMRQKLHFMQLEMEIQ